MNAAFGSNTGEDLMNPGIDGEASPGSTFPTAVAAVRARLALVCETYAFGTAAFPSPMSVADREAILALSDQAIEAVLPLLPIAATYSVDLDWLLAGDVGGLLHRARASEAGWTGGPRVAAACLPAIRGGWSEVQA